MRTIVNLNRSNTTWTLDPRVDTCRGLGSIAWGVGNQVSAEFNLVYCWHSAISKKDEKWTEDLYRELFGKPSAEVSMSDLLIGLKNWEAGMHKDPLIAQSHLAKIQSMLGKPDEAEATIRSVITTREKVLGPGHGNTLKSRGRPGGILELQGLFDEALALEEDIYAVAVKSLGIDHYETRGHKSSVDDLKYRISHGVADVTSSLEADPDVSRLESSDPEAIISP